VLAYGRTGLAMMGIGFVVARFGLMLRMMQPPASPALEAGAHGHALWLGTLLVLAGTGVNAMAAWQYRQQVNHLNNLHGHDVGASWLAMAVALLLCVIGVGIAGYLVAST
jgi:putative membrane protein